MLDFKNLKTLITSAGSSAKIYGVSVGDNVTITINTKTLEVEVTIN